MPAPKEYRSISKHALLRKYLDEGWDEKFSQYPWKDNPCGNRKTFRRKWDGDGFTLVYLREYHNPGAGGTQIVVHELRDGDVFYFVADPYA